MSRRMWMVAVAAWVAVVVAGSGLTWFAIARAGDQVTGTPGATSTQPASVGTVGSAPTAPATRTPRPPAPVTPTRTPSSPRPTATVAPTHTTPRPTRTATSAGARTETRTWTGSAGSMTVACTGTLAVLKGASPADGWSVDLGDDSGSEVQVKFAKDGNEVQVRAACVAGAPRFGVETSTSGSSSSPAE